MAGYISSNSERLYAAVETEVGQAAPITSVKRCPVVRFTARQQTVRPTRRDKTGSRTFPGSPSDLRRQTTFDVQTYLTSWTDTMQLPAYGSLFQAALGGAPKTFSGASFGEGTTAGTLEFTSAHGLVAGDAVAFGNEIRFVASVPDSQTVGLNQAFSVVPPVGAPARATVSFRPATNLPSVSVYSYRSPATAIQRVLAGASVNRMALTINGDFHQFQFSGRAADLVDNTSFQSGMAGLSAFPNEPALSSFQYSIVPGHLGQVWLGSLPARFYTLTDAEIALENDLEMRDLEFGANTTSAVVPGDRRVALQFSLFERDDAATQALYQAARQQSPIGVMFQLGQKAGQLCGVWMPNVVPEIPEFDDSETRVRWQFSASRAQGTVDDEIFVAFA